jgi:hypothetical protein
VNALAIDQMTFRLNPTLDNPINVELAPTFVYSSKKKKKKRSRNSLKNKNICSFLLTMSFVKSLFSHFCFQQYKILILSQIELKIGEEIPFFSPFSTSSKNRELFCCVSKKKKKTEQSVNQTT